MLTPPERAGRRTTLRGTACLSCARSDPAREVPAALVDVRVSDPCGRDPDDSHDLHLELPALGGGCERIGLRLECCHCTITRGSRLLCRAQVPGWLR